MILVFVETDVTGAAEPSLEAVTFARELATRDSGDLAFASGRFTGDGPDDGVDQPVMIHVRRRERLVEPLMPDQRASHEHARPLTRAPRCPTGQHNDHNEEQRHIQP